MQKHIFLGGLVLPLALGLSACASAPQVSRAQGDTYQLSAPKRSSLPSAAQWRAMYDQAQAHCASLGRSALPLEESAGEDARSGESLFLRFACVAAAR